MRKINLTGSDEPLAETTTTIDRSGGNNGNSRLRRCNAIRQLEGLLTGNNLKYLTMNEKGQIQAMINRIQQGGNCDR